MRISSWFGARGSARRQNWLRRLVMPAGHDDPEDEEIKRAAAADVAEIEEDNRYFDPEGPGHHQDEL